MRLHPEGVPSGGAMRRWTRRLARPRSTASPVELLTEVYSALMSAVVSLAMVLSLARLSGRGLPAAPPGATETVLPTAWVTVLLGPGLLAGVAGVMARLGPVALNPAQATWWLPLPTDRRSLLRGAALRWPGLGTLVGALLGAAVALSLGSSLAEGTLLTGAGAGAGAAAAAALSLAQARPAARRTGRLLSDGVVVAVPVLAVLVVVAGAPAPTVPTGMWAGAAASLAVAGALVALALARVGRVHDTDLRQRGAVTGEAMGALMGLDTRALGRALAESGRRTARRRSVGLGRLAAVPRRWRPAAALVTADLLLLVTGAAAYAAALAGVEGARRAQTSPVLDALLPISERHVRRWRLLLPAALMVLWMLAVLGVAAARLPGGPAAGWLVLAVLGGPAWAAAALRGAYRELPDWSAPLVHTPMGAVPPGLSAVVAKGPDLALLGAVPLAVALITGGVGVVLLGAQLGVTVLAMVLATRLPPSTS
ncbi:DUF6297 family protein [Georgenia sp. 10Sc9-8]|uniref:DUF6297 family protein n=1 Tax=Georgenia halotolerans TaxID=3028317 RepID=A0ABT5TWJ3_9MICO|nr:DUF6297 family protein [Georgenia halotolerans]